jgi:serine/threonine protein kinase
MTPERYQQLGRMFDAALERPPQDRGAWLVEACQGDAALQAEVEKLLANHVASDEFLAQPALQVAADWLAQNQAAMMPGQRLSHYEILSLLGAGGMGQVYLAKDARLGRQVALKLLPVRLMQSAEHLRRFEREALAVSALNHPNILTIYEFGQEGTTHFLATEYVPGENLRQRCKREPLSLAATLDITTQIVAALQAAHDAGIIHRDIKPDNVMIRKDGLVKVLDFGLAKLVEPAPPENGVLQQQQSSLTRQGAILGTVAYMSPEQARGQAVDVRTDIFSVGVMLYELLAGHQPFTGETVNHTIVAILEKEPPPITGRTIPAALGHILQRALAKKLEARYPDAQSLLTDLKHLVKRLEREEDLPLTALAATEAATQTPHFQTNEQFGAVTLRLPSDEAIQSSDKKAVTPAVPAKFEAEPDVPAITPAPLPAADFVAFPERAPGQRFWWLGALLAVLLIGLPTGQWLLRRSIHPLIHTTATLPERSLSYFLTVQRYRNGKLYQAEFQSSGREIFEPGWQFKLNVTSPQEGFLYLLNEDPQGHQVLLFPIPSHNSGSAHLNANERFQSGAYLFDEQPGTERFRLVWTAQPVPELEAVRHLVNPTDKGRISDPAQKQAIQTFLQQHSNALLESVRDPQNKQTAISGHGAVLVALIELEHR